MKVPYGEGVAIHTGPESCGVVRKGRAEALTGGCIGQVFSPERLVLQDADGVNKSEGNIVHGVIASDGLILRGRRPWACTEASRTGTGRSHHRPSENGAGVRVENPKGTRRR